MVTEFEGEAEPPADHSAGSPSDRLSIDEQQRLLRDAGRRAGWDDSAMDDYDRYDQLKANLE
jgi:hypothetical protein